MKNTNTSCLKKLTVQASFLVIFFSLQFLSVAASITASSGITQIDQAYFSENNSLVIHTKNKSELKILEIKKESPKNFKIYFSDSDLTSQLKKNFANDELSVSFRELSKQEEKDLGHKNITEVKLDFVNNPASEIQSRTILDGIAYELFPSQQKQQNLSQESDINSSNDILALDKTFDFETTEANQHLLQASKNEKLLNFSNASSKAEDFLNNLDSNISEAIVTDKEFIAQGSNKIDSVSLSHIGDSLINRGLHEDAYSAYQEALKLDANNTQALLGLAKSSPNKEEKLKSFMASIDNKVLMSIGEEWFKAGEQNLDNKLIAQSFIPYQFAILKDPKNPELRFAYASILEQAGSDFYAEAGKRYLEAAALAKESYQKGDQKFEELMRKSAEKLIVTSFYIGQLDQAIKYCNSYLNLGFDRFLDGRPVLGIVKEIRFNRNPFAKG